MIGQKGLPAQYGGVEKAVEELAARLVERGHQVTAFNKAEGDGPRPTEHRGIELRYVPAFGGKHLRNLTQSFSASISTLLRHYDVVHYHALGPCLSAPIARLRPGSRVVVTIQGRDDQRAKWSRPAQAVLTTAAWMSANVPHGRIAVSRQLQREFRDQFGKETVHIPNGVSAAPVASMDGVEDPLARFGLEPGRYLVNVGRLVPEKAIDQLLRAYGNVQTDLKLAIVGGSSHTDDYVDRLHRLAAADPRIVLTGPVYGAGTDRLFRNAAGYVMPSLLEGLPLALLEAISYGMPVAVSDIPPHLEVVGTSEPGQRVFRAGDLDEMAKQVQMLVDDLDDERDAAQLLRARVLEEYSWERVTDKTEELYQSLLCRTPVRVG
jgi:glycosyltransferase involved in cell wall biosynthesis